MKNPPKPLPAPDLTPEPDDHPNPRLIRATAVELVVADLRQRILSGELPPGSPLRQEALAAELGVSRIPLREAIRLLSSEGLIDLQPHRGAFVAPLSLKEMREFFELRVHMEPWLLKKAIPHMPPENLKRACDLVAEMDSAAASKWSRLNWQFHEALYQPADRVNALNIVRTLHEKSERYLRFQIVNVSLREQARDEHLELVELSRRGKAKEAAAAMERHIDGTTKHVLTLISTIVQ